MSAYRLPPTPSIAIPTIPFATWRNGFTDEEIEQIIKIGDSLLVKDAVVGDGNLVPEIRKSKTGWMSLTPETQFIYDKLGYIANQLNGQFFDFDIWGFVEDLQYTVYDGDNEHYTWHVDNNGASTVSPRKLTLVLQLSDPGEYEGGDLQLFTDPTPTNVDKEKGLVCSFPSYALHRVTPVTKGVRKTLVVWLSGPRFK